MIQWYYDYRCVTKMWYLEYFANPQFEYLSYYVFLTPIMRNCDYSVTHQIVWRTFRWQIPCWWAGCPTRNGEKLTCSQAEPVQVNNSAVACFPSISWGPSYATAWYLFIGRLSWYTNIRYMKIIHLQILTLISLIYLQPLLAYILTGWK